MPLNFLVAVFLAAAQRDGEVWRWGTGHYFIASLEARNRLMEDADAEIDDLIGPALATEDRQL
jgi:hypothetical protein